LTGGGGIDTTIMNDLCITNRYLGIVMMDLLICAGKGAMIVDGLLFFSVVVTVLLRGE
jgi:hypothetical protein